MARGWRLQWHPDLGYLISKGGTTTQTLLSKGLGLRPCSWRGSCCRGCPWCVRQREVTPACRSSPFPEISAVPTPCATPGSGWRPAEAASSSIGWCTRARSPRWRRSCRVQPMLALATSPAPVPLRSSALIRPARRLHRAAPGCRCRHCRSRPPLRLLPGVGSGDGSQQLAGLGLDALAVNHVAGVMHGHHAGQGLQLAAEGLQ